MDRFWAFLKKLTYFLNILLTPIMGLLLFAFTFYREMVPDEVIQIFVGVSVLNGMASIVAHSKA